MDILKIVKKQFQKFGLSEKSLKEIANLIEKTLSGNEELTEEQVIEQVKTFEPIAKSFQSEVERRVSEAKKGTNGSNGSDDESEEQGGSAGGEKGGNSNEILTQILNRLDGIEKGQAVKTNNQTGKNSANSKLTSVAGAGLVLGDIWSIKTNGFPFRIEDLPDVTNRPTHRKKIMIGDDNTAGISDKADISFELPNTMTVNHIYPQINQSVVYPEELAEFLKTYRTKQFTQMREEDWFYNYDENDIEPLKIFTKNSITTANKGKNGASQAGKWSLMSKKFPFDKKFIIELSISSDLSNFHQWGNNKIGICQNGNENSFNQAFSDFFTFSSEMVKIGEQFFNFKVSFRVIFAHIQDTLFIVALSGEAGKMASKISNINDFFGDFSILMTGGDHAFGSLNRTGIEMKYWVES